MLTLLLKTLLLVATLLASVTYMVWVERRVVAFMQNRRGPNRVGFGVLATLPLVGPLFTWTERLPFCGLGQPIADCAKLFLKEIVEPAGCDRFTYRLAPLLAVVAALLGFAVIPFTPDFVVLDRPVGGQIAELPVALLYVLAVSSLGAWAVTLAGWSSNSKYALLGALRAGAQMISYELPLGLALLAVVVASGSPSLREIVAAQDHGWFLLSQPLAFVIALIAAVAETNRAPFDLPEGESELVAGFHTEYSGMNFALFFLAEYTHMFLASALLTCLFLGGWRVPGLAASATPWPLGAAAFGLKIALLMLFYVWLRATLPRFRYDQLMRFSWKILVPLAALNLAAAAVLPRLA